MIHQLSVQWLCMVSTEEMLAVIIIATPVPLPNQTLNEHSPGLLEEEEGYLVQEHTFY